MQNYIISAIAASLVFPIAEASAFTTIGTVEAVSGHEVIIQEGDVFRLPASYDLANIRAGQKVAITWQSQQPQFIELGDENFAKVLDASAIVVAE